MSDQQMSLVEHLADLRKRLIATMVVFVLFLILSFVFVDRIFSFLRSAADPGIALTVLGPGDVLRIYFMIAGLTAIALTVPFALYQIWAFVSPALTKEEKNITLRYIPSVLLMFLLGVLFAWYIVFPMLFSFLIKLGSKDFNMMITAANYFGFMTNIIVPFGFIFEMPVVVLFLTRIGMITPDRLIKVRKYAYLVLVIIGSMISPPEFVSHISVSIPMVLLYETSIWVAKWGYRQRVAARTACEAIDCEEM
ncbi:Sec-independent protein translocase protein TatCd [Collibacillus ludicampi]|uniref:Sec-independent protein translocase protein TatC n=1 Tax=Collibacillus ludicampi TaxID=2771369 RepID=A0AAV4LEY5_9BACL|nr:twin-arginine translocase subunit TatC [Collibacillus ludicampi]GIM46328.1 Sec-independent protein translocase protein TatCd [Collibacillus ludicampi]